MIRSYDRESVWFWYNPVRDCVVQEPATHHRNRVDGLFESRWQAIRILEEYAETYGLAETGYLVLYEATLTRQDHGGRLADAGSSRLERTTETHPTDQLAADQCQLDEFD